jgi:hypothetical protein
MSDNCEYMNPAAVVSSSVVKNTKGDTIYTAGINGATKLHTDKEFIVVQPIQVFQVSSQLKSNGFYGTAGVFTTGYDHVTLEPGLRIVVQTGTRDYMNITCNGETTLLLDPEGAPRHLGTWYHKPTTQDIKSELKRLVMAKKLKMVRLPTS